jgi:Transposase
METVYFTGIDQHTTVETTTGWYWMNDLLEREGVDLSLAHAQFVKAISYAKVKTNKVDAHTLAQLLRVGMIPEAHKISTDLRDVRDTLRARLHLVEKHTSAMNSVHRVLEGSSIPRTWMIFPNSSVFRPICIPKGPGHLPDQNARQHAQRPAHWHR